jgi:hypothetical protein
MLQRAFAHQLLRLNNKAMRGNPLTTSSLTVAAKTPRNRKRERSSFEHRGGMSERNKTRNVERAIHEKGRQAGGPSIVASGEFLT